MKKKVALKTEMAKFLKDINFKLLNKQKLSLSKLMGFLAESDTPALMKDMEGILLLIDEIQDIAVDEYGYREKDVFNISKKK